MALPIYFLVELPKISYFLQCSQIDPFNTQICHIVLCSSIIIINVHQLFWTREMILCYRFRISWMFCEPGWFTYPHCMSLIDVVDHFTHTKVLGTLWRVCLLLSTKAPGLLIVCIDIGCNTYYPVLGFLEVHIDCKEFFLLYWLLSLYGPNSFCIVRNLI